MWVFGVEAVEFVGDVSVYFSAGYFEDGAGGAGGEVGLFEDGVVSVERAYECFFGVSVDDEELGLF